MKSLLCHSKDLGLHLEGNKGAFAGFKMSCHIQKGELQASLLNEH
jgi:hypothetical protein